MSAQSDILVRSDADRGLFLTVAISALVHLAVLAFIAFVPSRLFERPRVESYTVDLIAPSVIGGTNVRPGTGPAKPAAPKPVVNVPAKSEPLGPPEPPVAKVEKVEPAPVPKIPDPPIQPAPKVEAKPVPPPLAPKPAEVAPPAPKPEVVAPKPAPKPPAPKAAPVAKAEPAPKPPPPVAKVPPKAKPAAEAPAAKPEARPPTNPDQDRDRRIAEAVGQRAKQVEKAPPASKAPDPIDSRIEAAVQRRAAQLEDGAGEGSGGPISYGPGTGAGGVVQGVEYILYRNQMESRIKAAWAWAGANRSLKAVVQFNILATGEIVNVHITGPSGDSAYDTSVERAIRAVSPLDPPPERYREDFSVVELEFRPEDLES